MKRLFNPVIIVAFALIVLVASWMSLNYFSYKRYHNTIYKTQTIDFNILHHFAPTKLSLALMEKDVRAINEALLSNFRVFDLVVTDCKTDNDSCANQKILYSNIERSNLYPSLQGKAYDVLRSPPPLNSEKKYVDIGAAYSEKKEVINDGEIIGRVYYLRRGAPPFSDTLKYWINTPDMKDRYTYTYNGIYSVIVSMLLALLGFASLKFYSKRSEIKVIEAEIKRKESEQVAQDEKIKAIEAENKYLRVVNFNNVIVHAIDEDFASVVANKVQRLDSVTQEIMARIDISVRDISHDMNKAPMLAKGESAIEQINSVRLKFSDNDIDNLFWDIQQSIEAIKWVLEDLKDIARIEQEEVNVVNTIKRLEARLPPLMAGQKWLDITFDYKVPEDTVIEANGHHLSSIIKNALYNATAALSKKHRELIRSKSVDVASFRGLVRIVIEKTDKEVLISIVDNGPGIPVDIIGSLYESSERISKYNNTTSGNGSIIVSAYLQLHGGRVKKESNDSGAAVVFIFPLKIKG